MADELRVLCESIICSLDDNGYLLYQVEELVRREGEETPDPDLVAKAHEALRIVQSLDPKGVACRDTQECLLLQISEGPEYDLPRSIVQHHLEDLRLNRLPKIAKETGRAIGEIKEAIAFIGDLNPRPGSQFSAGQSQYVIPDVIVEYVDGKYEVSLQDAYIPRLKVSPAYERMLQDQGNDATTKDFVRKKIQAARWLMESIEQRRATVYKIASEIVRQQYDFLDKGIAYLHPLKMQAVADKTGVHVSTVSRAISDKYIQTPRGIYPMKFFFTGGIESDDGSQVSTKSVQQALQDVLEKEDRRSPLSDEEIVAKLKERGMNISRRTVTKYRKQLSIPSSRQRREY
jgi:RNA polymerase sigma-54 factor